MYKGLNCAVKPDKVSVEEHIAAVEQATWRLPQDQKDKLRAYIASVLKSAKAPTPNLPAQGRKTLKALQKSKHSGVFRRALDHDPFGLFPPPRIFSLRHYNYN